MDASRRKVILLRPAVWDDRVFFISSQQRAAPKRGAPFVGERYNRPIEIAPGGRRVQPD